MKGSGFRDFGLRDSGLKVWGSGFSFFFSLYLQGFGLCAFLWV